MAKRQKYDKRDVKMSTTRGGKHDVGLIISVVIVLVLLFFLLSS